MVKSNKISVSSKKHEDREFATKSAFETSSIDIHTPQTMILLLASEEHMVVLKAVSILDKYASRLEQNTQVLYEAGVLKLLLPLLEHSELFIRRFASKLLSQLSFLPHVVERLVEEKLVPHMMEILNNNSDHVVQEFSSLVVAELTKTDYGLSQLLESNLFHCLIPLLKSTDPDIQKNCLQIIFNMIQDPSNHPLLTNKIDFNIKVFIDLLMSEYVAIQNLSLDNLNILTQKTKGNTVPKDFQDAGGISIILTILKNFEWKDIHSKCLDILGNIYNDPNIAQHFLKDGVLQLFHYMDFINDPHLRKKAVEVIAKTTEIPSGRLMLAESGQAAKLAAMILEQSAGLTAAVSTTISGLVQDYQGLQQVLQTSTVEDLLAVLADNSRDWSDKTAAVNALYEILKRDVDSCVFVVSSHKSDVLSSILTQFNEDVPIHAATTAANCITTISRIPELKPKMINRNLISSILHCFKDFNEDTTPLKLSACEALCSLLSEPTACSILKSLDGLPIIWSSVTKQPNNVQFLQSAANFVHLCVENDKSFTEKLLKLNVVNWLLSQSSLRNECPSWEVALETVLNRFLPLKFAMTGRLDLTDVTENGFYVTRMGLTREEINKNKFPVMSDFITNKSCPTQTLYFANFDDGNSSRRSITFNLKTSLSTQAQSLKEDTRSILYDWSTFEFADQHLQSYIESLKSILKQNGFTSEDKSSSNSVVDGDTIKGKVLLIGQFVSNQMVGVDKTENCSNHTLDLHINELKVEIMNSMIPVGWMRVGLHLERAFLFKVLADRVGLPASLVRGKYRRAWIEVAIPNIPPAPRPSYPNHLLRPNYVVDLMSSPVALYLIKSYEADVYCGLV